MFSKEEETSGYRFITNQYIYYKLEKRDEETGTSEKPNDPVMQTGGRE